jgi:hypothetical protein
MSPDEVARCFTRPDGSFRFARWARPVAPMVYGVAEASLPVLKGGVAVVAGLAGQAFAETDPEAGFNNLLICVAGWSDLKAAPGLKTILPDIAPLADRLAAESAEQYRLFRFSPEGGIVHCLTLMRLSGALAQLPADLLALGNAVATALDWAPGALAEGITRPGPEGAELRPDLIALLRAAYHPALPDAATDPAFAYRLAARL